MTRFGIPGHIAINMIMAVAAGGTVAVVIAVGVQVLCICIDNVFPLNHVISILCHN